PLSVGGQPAHLTPRVGKEPQRPGSGDRRIQLPQRTRRRVAWIGEHGPAGPRLLLVEGEKGRPGHVDLAAHLADLRNAFALELTRNVGQNAHVGRHVLPHRAITPRSPGYQPASLV